MRSICDITVLRHRDVYDYNCARSEVNEGGVDFSELHMNRFINKLVVIEKISLNLLSSVILVMSNNRK